MLGERPQSIMCETCGGWHTTEAHAQYEKEAREKRMAEIKARPDSVYRFDTLGFTPDQKAEIEPWMNGVIEKAKELGDDLQDSDFFFHSGPFERGRSNLSAMSFLAYKSFQELPRHTEVTSSDYYKRTSRFKKPGTLVWTSEMHRAGEPLIQEEEEGHYGPPNGTMGWAGVNTKLAELFVKQERWLTNREPPDLKSYKQAIFSLMTASELPQFLEGEKNYSREDLWKYKRKIEKELMETLDDAEERRKIVLSIQKNRGFGGQTGGGAIGIIFHINPLILAKFPKVKREDIPGDIYTIQDGEPIVSLRKITDNETIITPNNEFNDLESAREFYQEFIHGVVVTYGSVEAQRETLKKMLETTKDDPNRRLPIYNFYGKLVWPRPPEEEK